MLPDRIEFTKMTAAGNDFVCINNTEGTYDALLKSNSLPRFVRAVCRRGLSVGADGVIVACERGSGGGVDIVARFLEPDGSEARLCGNGTACFTYWVLERGLVRAEKLDILTAAGTATGYPCKKDPSRIRVCVPDPRDLETNITVTADGREWLVHYLDTGVPHIVTYVEDLCSVNVARSGAALRHHSRFKTVGGANVNFVKVHAEGRLAIRTFEFGVEAETLACGTGSSAAAIVTTLLRDWDHGFRTGREPIHVSVRGGGTLRVWFLCRDHDTITDVCMETRPLALYDGVLRPGFLKKLQKAVQQEDA